MSLIKLLLPGFLLAFLFLFPPRALAVDYYVSKSGCSDSGPGSQSQPWCTIQKAANTVPAGSKVIVISGGNFTTERVSVNRPGITFQGQGNPIIKGFEVYADNTAITGFEVTGAVHSNWITGWGIYVKAKNCLIENNYVHYATDGGIGLFRDAGNPEQTSDCIIRNNRLYQNSQVGIEVHGRRHVVENNEIWGTIQFHPGWTSPWADADGIRAFGENHVFRVNYVHDISFDGTTVRTAHIDCLQTWNDSGHESLKNSIIEQNKCIFDVALGAPDAVDKGVQLEGGASNLIIRNNIFKGFHAVMFINNCSYNKIYNNTFIASLNPSGGGQTAAFHIEDSPHNTFRNNIIYDVMEKYIYPFGNSATGLDAGYNLVYRSDGQTPQGSPYPHDLWGADPRFVNVSIGDYQLQSNSPAIGAGLNLYSQGVTSDYDGSPRPSVGPFAIGAYEYGVDPVCQANLDTSNPLINLADIVILLSSWGQDNPVFDLVGNGSVDLSDITFILQYWGQSCGL